MRITALSSCFLILIQIINALLHVINSTLTLQKRTHRNTRFKGILAALKLCLWARIQAGEVVKSSTCEIVLQGLVELSACYTDRPCNQYDIKIKWL